MKLFLAALLLLGACKSKGDAPKAAAAAKLTDLTRSLEGARAEFNGHKKEARFITLLSPV